MSITPKQRDAMRFMQRYIDANACAPSYTEIAAGVGLASKSGVVALVDGLEAAGYIARVEFRRRAITILKRVPDADAPPNAEALAAYKAALSEIAAGGASAWEHGEKARAVLARWP